MGSGTTRSSATKDDLLKAAAELFLSDGCDLFVSVSNRKIARKANYSEATVRSHFPTRAELASHLISYLLRPDADSDPVAAMLANLGHDLSEREDLFDAIVEISRCLLLANQSSPTLAARAALWTHALEDDSVREKLLDSYRTSERGGVQSFNQFIADHADVVRRRVDWLSSSEFSIAVTALLDGLAMRAKLDPESVAPCLPGRLIAALIVSAIAIDHEDSVPERLRLLQKLRTANRPAGTGAAS